MTDHHNDASQDTCSNDTVNLLDLASAALSSSIVSGNQITAMARIRDQAENKDGTKPKTKTTDSALPSSQTDHFMNIRLKEDGSFVTNADLAAQQIIFQSIYKVSRNIRIVGEESEDDMAHHHVTGFEARADELFQLARCEVWMRYEQSSNHDCQGESDNGNGPEERRHLLNQGFPLGEQQEFCNDRNNDYQSRFPNSKKNTSANGNPENTAPYIVDCDRVSVFIDPLDGTKAYAKGDYDPVSILIAIVLDETPCFGVICKPFGYQGQTSVLDTGCFAIYGGTLLGAAYTAGGGICSAQRRSHTTVGRSIETEVEAGENISKLPRAVISSSRSQGIVQEFVAQLSARGMIHSTPLMVSGAGEKSLRIILRVENEGLWFFPKPGTSLWDVAASDALLRATGGRLTDKNGYDMDYSKSRLDAGNQDGVVACYDLSLHAECIRIFTEGTWSEI